MWGEKRENGGRKVGQRLWWFFDGLGYKGDVGLGGGKVRRVMALRGCRGIMVWRVGRIMLLGACKGPWFCVGVQRGRGLGQGEE